MELLDIIQRDILKQKEEEALNLFSPVNDFREFIVATRPTANVSVTLKMCCIFAERVEGIQGTRVILVDAMKRVNIGVTLQPAGQDIVQVIVWDDHRQSVPVSGANIPFREGGLYLLHQVEFVGIYDGEAKGSVQYDFGNSDKVREIGPPLKMPDV